MKQNLVSAEKGSLKDGKIEMTVENTWDELYLETAAIISRQSLSCIQNKSLAFS